MKRFFQGKNVVITGAASGIGQDLAVVLISWGVKVALFDIQRIPLENKDNFLVDVTDAEGMDRACRALIDSWGRVDIVVAAAGVGGINPAPYFSLAIDKKIMSINYFGTVNTFAPFIEHLSKNSSGHLVGICSLAAFRGLPQAGSYSASKAAQMTLLESFRLDLKKSGVRVSCIHPGFVTTPMTEHDEFEMPFKVSVRESTNIILRAIASGKSQTGYPWQMSLLSKLNRLLPNCVYDFLMPRLSPSKGHRPRILSSLKEE
ncbi:MAG TPA: SDR family NAD(P)-dependent oxidoreductase [Bacteriovoracaceae bacterium]|nr:SDR family NAD(P)-dependent oxidoreductase [Bacteriovoracaceae bacterium]